MAIDAMSGLRSVSDRNSSGILDSWRTRVRGCCGCCRCCRPTGTGRAASWPTGWRSARAPLRRDVDRLRELGYPVHASRGVAGGYQLQAGAALPPLLLDDEEAVAIAVGLRAAAAGAVAGIEETSVRALAKVVQVMPPRLRRRVDALRAYTVPACSAAARASTRPR